jgi:hypothetical protein
MHGSFTNVCSMTVFNTKYKWLTFLFGVSIVLYFVKLLSGITVTYDSVKLTKKASDSSDSTAWKIQGELQRFEPLSREVGKITWAFLLVNIKAINPQNNVFLLSHFHPFSTMRACNHKLVAWWCDTLFCVEFLSLANDSMGMFRAAVSRWSSTNSWREKITLIIFIVCCSLVFSDK